jgi:hypothetical protein
MIEIWQPLVLLADLLRDRYGDIMVSQLAIKASIQSLRVIRMTHALEFLRILHSSRHSTEIHVERLEFPDVRVHCIHSVKNLGIPP